MATPLNNRAGTIAKAPRIEENPEKFCSEILPATLEFHKFPLRMLMGAFST